MSELEIKAVKLAWYYLGLALASSYSGKDDNIQVAISILKMLVEENEDGGCEVDKVVN